MNKIEVTKEQAAVIETLKGRLMDQLERLIESPEDYEDKFKPLTTMNSDNIFKAITNGYQIDIHDIEVGDWLVHLFAEKVVKVLEVKTEKGRTKVKIDDYVTGWLPIVDFRYATSEETKEEKSRRFFEENGRKNWQLRVMDILVDKEDNLYVVTKNMEGIHLDFLPVSIEEIKETLRVATFVEDRKDLN